MPFNGDGTFVRFAGTLIANQGLLDSSQVNNETTDLINAMDFKVNRDGKLPMTGDLPMAGFKITGSGSATVSSGLPTLSQVQAGAFQTAATVGGTVDAMIVTMNPITTVQGRFTAPSIGPNTIVAPTINKDSLGVVTIKKGAGLALSIGDTGPIGYPAQYYHNGTDYILLNPYIGVVLGDAGQGIANAFTQANTHAGAETFNAATSFNSSTSYSEQTLVVTAGSAAWNMSLGPNAVASNAANLTFAAPTNIPTTGAGLLRVNNTTGSNITVIWNAAFSALANNGALPVNLFPGLNYFVWSSLGGVVFISPAVQSPGVPVLLNTLTAAASATLSDTTSFTSAYKYYKIVCENLLPATNAVSPRLLPQINAAFQGTCTYNSFHQSSVNGGGGNATSTIAQDVVSNVAANGGFNSNILVYNSVSATVRKIFRIDNSFYDGSTVCVDMGTMVCTASALAMTGFQFAFSAGNITSGTIKIYGWN
jgi:hypothetical protein